MPSNSKVKNEKAQRFLRSKIFIILVLAVVWQGYTSLSRWSEQHAFMINLSESLPNWGLFVESGRFPERGEYVVFHPGDDPLTVQYFGKEPSPFAKIAYGIPGDEISHAGSDVLVNGEKIASLKPLTLKGDALTVGPTGVVPDGCVFAATPHKDGFDSRYSHIGFVCRDRLVGTAQPVL